MATRKTKREKEIQFAADRVAAFEKEYRRALARAYGPVLEFEETIYAPAANPERMRKVADRAYMATGLVIGLAHNVLASREALKQLMEAA